MPASAPLVPVRPAPRSLKPSPGPLEIFADGLAIEIPRDDRGLSDSPLAEAGFEPSVPLCPHPGLIGSFVGDRGSWRSGCCDARVLQSINSESIMAGRRCVISRSTCHVSTEIWLTNSAIVWWSTILKSSLLRE